MMHRIWVQSRLGLEVRLRSLAGLAAKSAEAAVELVEERQEQLPEPPQRFGLEPSNDGNTKPWAKRKDGVPPLDPLRGGLVREPRGCGWRRARARLGVRAAPLSEAKVGGARREVGAIFRKSIASEASPVCARGR